MKKFFIRRKANKLVDRLEELQKKGRRLRGDREDLRWEPWYDFLTKPEQIEYSTLAMKHEALSVQLGEHSDYFSPKRDFWKDIPNSPEGTLTVGRKAAVEVDYRRDKDGKIWKYENGKRAEGFPVSDDILGTTIEEEA